MDIAKVLKLNKYEQVIWCRENIKEYNWRGGESLADLAFRLRNEVCGEVVHFLDRFNFEMCLREIYENCKGEYNEFLIWLICEAKPIHWILAAIRAKE